MGNFVIGTEPYTAHGHPGAAMETAVVVSLNQTVRQPGIGADLPQLKDHPAYPALVAYVQANPVAAKA